MKTYKILSFVKKKNKTAWPGPYAYVSYGNVNAFRLFEISTTFTPLPFYFMIWSGGDL